MERDLLANAVVAGTLIAAIVLVGANAGNSPRMALNPSSEVPVDRSEADLTIRGGTDVEKTRLRLAIRRFEEAGLALPSLSIVFREASHSECHGARGYFSTSGEAWRISLCSDMGWVYEHELAHAWERAHLTDVERGRYTGFRGLPTWSDKDYDWNERGVEDVAVVIQQGIAGLPLPPALGYEARSKLQGYEVLTGQIAPRLVKWMARFEVSCSDRPTHLSHQVPDMSGRVCEAVTPGERRLVGDESRAIQGPMA